jgi:hypothetical protein
MPHYSHVLANWDPLILGRFFEFGFEARAAIHSRLSKIKLNLLLQLNGFIGINNKLV